MKITVAEKIELALQDCQPAIRDKLSRQIQDCGIIDPDDPQLNVILSLCIISGQPIRIVENGGANLATEAGMARLGDRLQENIWGVLYPRWIMWLSILFWSVLLSGATVWTFTRFTRAPDVRLILLEHAGAELKVDASPDETTVSFTGEVQPIAAKAHDGRYYLYFPRK